jgi:hypothetical protein
LFNDKDPLCSDFIRELKKRLNGKEIYAEWDKEKYQIRLNLYVEKIQQSHKVVVLFTKDFLDDVVNSYIACLAFMKKIERYNLIPVRFSGGGKPDFLMCISDVEFEDDGWKTDKLSWTKLIKAILLPDKVNNVCLLLFSVEYLFILYLVPSSHIFT